MATYLKEFKIHNTTYGIEKTSSNLFQMWRGGCAVGRGFETFEECLDHTERMARDALVTHLHNLESEVAQVKMTIKELFTILDVKCKHVDQHGMWCKVCGEKLYA